MEISQCAYLKGKLYPLGMMVCSTLNMDHTKLKTELSERRRENYIQASAEIIFKQLHLPVTTVTDN